MKKLITIVALAFIVVATPVFAVVQSQENTTTTTRNTNRTRTNYGEDAEGIKQRIQELKQLRIEEKEQKRQEISQVTVKVAKKKIDNIIKRYKAIQARVAKMKVISEDLKTRLNEAIGAEITKLEGYKNQLEGAQTVEEVKAIMEKMKADVKSGKDIVKEIVAAIHASHYSSLQVRLQTVLDKLEARIEKLNEEDKTILTKMATDIKAKLDEAKRLLAEGKTQEAKEKLKEARLDMVKLHIEIKKAEENVTLNSTETDEESTNESTTQTTN